MGDNKGMCDKNLTKCLQKFGNSKSTFTKQKLKQLQNETGD